MHDQERQHDIRPERSVQGMPEEVLRRVLERCVQFEPYAAAILLRGSYATGTAGEDSDLDLTVITHEEPRTPYRSWFEQAPDAKPLPVSVSSKSLQKWVGKSDRPAEWALGFPATDVAEYLWATDDAREQLGVDPSTHRPADVPSLEDFVNTAVKVRRAQANHDSTGVRLYAREVALLAPALLRKLNPEVVVRTHREAVLAARDFPEAPEHYKEDFSTAAGLLAAEDDAVAQACQRLATELLAFLRERDPNIDPQPDIAQYLIDGTLQRYLNRK